MAKAEWGSKRTCQSCTTRFYDMRRDPITCPKCGAVFDPVIQARPKRTRSAAAARSATQPVPAADAAAERETDAVPVELIDKAVGDLKADDDGDDADDAEIGKDEEDLVEDASELGEDEDDMVEVRDNVEDEEP